MQLFVNGTLMRGEALHQNMSACQFVHEARTAPSYRLFLMGGGSYPGMIRVAHGGVCIAGELYEVPDVQVDDIFAREPPHLYLGEVELEDGSRVQGVLCDPEATHQRPEITAYGGWRAWRKHMDAIV
jgi:gamma-glutamylcyclotransferase (GGCT)/AIG2-like uncharacterized protein YtfP